MASRRLDTYFYGLSLVGPGLVFGLKTCIDNFWHHPEIQGSIATVIVNLEVIIVN